MQYPQRLRFNVPNRLWNRRSGWCHGQAKRDVDLQKTPTVLLFQSICILDQWIDLYSTQLTSCFTYYVYSLYIYISTYIYIERSSRIFHSPAKVPNFRMIPRLQFPSFSVSRLWRAEKGCSQWPTHPPVIGATVLGGSSEKNVEICIIYIYMI